MARSLVPGPWLGPRRGRRRTGAAWPTSTGRRALFRTAVVLAVLASLVSPTGPGAAASVTTTTSDTAPGNLSGTWYMTDTWTTGGGVSTDTTVVNQTSAGVYTVYHASDASSITTDVPISGSSFYYWSCNGGGTYSQSDESACQTGWFDTTWNLDLSTNPYTAKGTAQGFNQLGTLLASGTFTAYFVPATEASLAVAISAPIPPAGLPVGQDETIGVTVTAGAQALSSVDLSDVTSADVKVVAEPPGASDFSLAAGTSRTFDLRIEGVAAGSADLSSTATGVAAGGQRVRGSATDDFRLTGPGLRITLATSPAQLKLAVNDKGEVVPGKVTVTVTFTNTSKATIDNAQLLVLAPTAVVRSQQLNKLGLPSSALPLSLGDLPAGAKAVFRKFTLAVTGDGKYQWRALATYNDASRAGGNGRASAVGGAFEASVPYLYLRASRQSDAQAGSVTTQGGSDWVKGGQSWYVSGEIKNLSSYQALCLSPLFATSSGNAISTGLQDVSQQNADTETPPLAGLLRPGQSFPLGMLVRTSSTGPTQSSVSIVLNAYKADPGASCQVEEDGSLDGQGQALGDDEMVVQKGSTSYTVHVDVSANPDPSQVSSGTLNFIGGFAKGSFDFYGGIALALAGVAKWAANNPATLFKVATLPFNVPAQVEFEQAFLGHVSSLTSLFVGYMEKVVPETPGYNPFQVASITWSRVGDDAYAKITKASATWSEQWTKRIEQDYANGAPESWMRDLSEVSGETVGQLQAVFLQLFVEKTFAQIASQAPKLEEVGAALTDEPKVITSSKGGVVPVSRVLTAADLEQGWGITEAVAAKLRAIAKQFDVLIGARSRQTVSIELEKLGAIWKNSNFHQKTVSFIDRAYLGMNIKQGLLGFRSFTDEGIAYARKLIIDSGLKSSEKLEALDRLTGRIAENGSDFQKMQKLANMERRACPDCPLTKGWVNAGFNSTESGSAAARTAGTRWRRFMLRETSIYGDNGAFLGTQYEPFEEAPNLAQYAKNPDVPLPQSASLCIRDLGTVLCPITGDIDLVYITNVFGGALDPEKMYQVFKALDDAGFAHTDLVTWVEQQTGKFFFPGKEGQLAGLVPGEESCAQFAPDSIERGTYVTLKDSLSVGPNSYWLLIDGGYHPAMH